MYCTYLTIYRGDILPRRYIGSSSVQKVESGYVGSISSLKWKTLFEQELLNNRHLFKTRILSSHNTRQEALDHEYQLHIKYDVVFSNIYMNESVARPNGFFGRDVSGPNNPMYGKSRTGEKHSGGDNISKAKLVFYRSDDGINLKKKMSELLSGENNPMYGKSHSNEQKLKWSLERRGCNNPMYGNHHTNQTKQRISSTRNQRILNGEIVPWNKGRTMTEEQKEKLRVPRTEIQKQKMRTTYCVNGHTIVTNAKQYCVDNGYNYTMFTQAAKHNRPYRGLTITIADTAS